MNVDTGKNTEILSGTIVMGNARIGKNNRIGPNAIIGSPPEHIRYYKGEFKHNGFVFIGDNNIIRENVSIQSPTASGTLIGSNCLLFTGSYVAHDVVVGDGVTLSSGARLGGYCDVFDNVNIGMNASVHQHSTIGFCAMIGMGAAVVKDVKPFLIYKNGICDNINRVGMRKLGYTSVDIEAIDGYYRGFRKIPKFAEIHMKQFYMFSERKVAEIEL